MLLDSVSEDNYIVNLSKSFVTDQSAECVVHHSLEGWGSALQSCSCKVDKAVYFLSLSLMEI